MARSATVAFLIRPAFVLFPILLLAALRPPSDPAAGSSDEDAAGTRWAVLVAGSKGLENYRHQDYVGNQVNGDNFFAVLLGNKSALTGGSGKVVASGPNDNIFIFYSGHGSTGFLSMPAFPNIYAVALNNVLNQMHASRSYKNMVIYVEASESGSIFNGLLPEDINILVTTSAKPEENSWSTYCDDYYPPYSRKFKLCLGNLYSISWMENSETYDLRTKTLKQQYELVKHRVSVKGTYNRGSHIMQYGDMSLNSITVSSFIGSNPANDGAIIINHKSSFPKVIINQNQRDANLEYFWQEYLQAPYDSSQKQEAWKELQLRISHISHLDNSMELLGMLLFGSEQGPKVLKTVPPAGQPAVDNWACYESMVMAFEQHCGSLYEYGLNHMQSFANFCNAGISIEKIAKVIEEVKINFIKAREGNYLSRIRVLGEPAKGTHEENRHAATPTYKVAATTAIKDKYNVKKHWSGHPCSPRQYVWDGLNCSYDPEPQPSNLSSSGLTGEVSPLFGQLASLNYLFDCPNGSMSVPYTDCDKKKSKLNIVIPSAVAVVVVLLTASVFVMRSVRRRCLGTALHSPIESHKEDYPSHYEDHPSVSNVDQQHSLDEKYFGHIPKAEEQLIKVDTMKFTHMQLAKINNNYTRKIGRGGFGNVYHGYVETVKIQSQSSPQGAKQFLAEVQNLARASHRNLVKLYLCGLQYAGLHLPQCE